MDPRIRQRCLGAFLSLVLLTGCGSRAVDPPPDEPGRLLSGTGASDTVSAALGVPLQLLIVGAAGAPAVGVQVIFDGVNLVSHFISLFVSHTAQLHDATYADTATTDSQGRAQTSIFFSVRTGDAFLRVTVPSLGFRDSARYTISPGNPARIVVSPSDPAILVGNAVVLRGAVADRFGNARTEPVSFTASSGPVTTTAAGIVTGTGLL